MATENRKFRTFVVLDFETSNLPQQRNNTVGITELSVYGLDTNEFNNTEVAAGENALPNLPRVLHKLTLMINPGMPIDRIPAEISGLTNQMLENESTFNQSTAEIFLSFLKRLQPPTCLVAHNGWKFDFPILKYVLERVGLKVPDDIYALDSMRAFYGIDDMRRQGIIYENRIRPESAYNWRSPGKYTLKDVYKRIFTQEPRNAHQAEADVKTLAQLMLHYGRDFVNYANNYAIPFSQIRNLEQLK